MKIQQEKAKSLAMEDFGLEDDDQLDSDFDGPEKAFRVITITLAFTFVDLSTVAISITGWMLI